MVALRAQRRVFMWHIMPQPVPASAPVNVGMAEITELLEKLFSEKRAFAYLNKDGRLTNDASAADIRNCIYIADIVTSKTGRYKAFLINRGDPDVAHPSFLNPLANEVVTVPPADDQTLGWSAHLVIDMEQHQGKHRACFERMPAVSSTLVDRYINSIMKAETENDPKYTYKRPKKRGNVAVDESKSYRPAFMIKKVPASSLINDIERGVLSNIRLIKTASQYQGPGDPSLVSSSQFILEVRPKPLSADQARLFAKDVAAWGRSEQYDEVQLEIRSLEGGTSARPRFSLEQDEAMDTLYARTKLLDGFSRALENCYAKINIEIVKKMVAEINQDENW